jgi:hypothetical protein
MLPADLGGCRDATDGDAPSLILRPPPPLRLVLVLLVLVLLLRDRRITPPVVGDGIPHDGFGRPWPPAPSKGTGPTEEARRADGGTCTPDNDDENDDEQRGDDMDDQIDDEIEEEDEARSGPAVRGRLLVPPERLGPIRREETPSFCMVVLCVQGGKDMGQIMGKQPHIIAREWLEARC